MTLYWPVAPVMLTSIELVLSEHVGLFPVMVKVPEIGQEQFPVIPVNCKGEPQLLLSEIVKSMLDASGMALLVQVPSLLLFQVIPVRLLEIATDDKSPKEIATTTSYSSVARLGLTSLQFTVKLPETDSKYWISADPFTVPGQPLPSTRLSSE